jgi:hypothetical protein
MSDAMLARLEAGVARRREQAIARLEATVLRFQCEADLEEALAPYVDRGERGVLLGTDPYAEPGRRDAPTAESQRIRARFQALQRHVRDVGGGRYQLAFWKHPVLAIVIPHERYAPLLLEHSSLVHFDNDAAVNVRLSKVERQLEDQAAGQIEL